MKKTVDRILDLDKKLDIKGVRNKFPRTSLIIEISFMDGQ